MHKLPSGYVTDNHQGNMTHFERDEVPMLSGTHAQQSNEPVVSNLRRFVSRTRSASIYNPVVSMEPNERETHIVFHNSLGGDANSFGRKLSSFRPSWVPGVMKPHSKAVQQWNKVLVIFCLMAIFVDPLFFFLIYVRKDYNCIAINWTMTRTLVSIRSINDFLYFLNILLQFRLAYVARSRVVDTGELVDHPKKIALNYLKGYFLFDLFVVLPLPQIVILCVLPRSLGSSGANYAKNLLRAAILIQYLPRLFRFLPLPIGQSPTGFIFESDRANFVINLFIFMLSGHVVGSCWYLFGLQRVNQCLRDACHHSNLPRCMELIDCDPKMGQISNLWSNNTDANACLNSTSGAFTYGIYANAVPLTIETKVVKKYVYALFWGFQQISTLAGNQSPSYFEWEILFTMAIIGLGLFLFALLIGNMQNFLQALARRRLEMQIRGRDVEQWMGHQDLPEVLRRRVRQAEMYNWAATRASRINGQMLLENFPEDLQTDIRRHLFKFVKNVRIFALMDEPILDAIRERLKQKIYIKGSRIVSQGDLVEKIVFVVHGKLESIEEDGIRFLLREGDACGQELLNWYFENSSVSTDGNKVRLPRQRFVSNRTVRCFTNVEAFSLRAADLEEVTMLFPRLLQSSRIQGALRYESPHWRSFAATQIQVAWRYRKKRRVNTSQSDQTLKSYVVL